MDSVPGILAALGLTGEMGAFDGNRVVLRTEAYERIHDILGKNHPDTAANLMFALAHTGIHTTADPAVGKDEVWLLEGWKK